MREIITIDADPIVRLDNGPALDRVVGNVRITVTGPTDEWAMLSVTDAWAKLREAERAVRDAQAQRDEIAGWLRSTENGVWCDHPDTSGNECEVCDGWVEPSEEMLADDDYWRVAVFDAEDLAASGLVADGDAENYRATARRRFWL